MKKLRVWVVLLLLAPAVFPQTDKATPTPAQEELRPVKLSAAFRALAEEAYDAVKRAAARQFLGGADFRQAHLEAERLVDVVKRKAASRDEKMIASRLWLWLFNTKQCAEILEKRLGMDLYARNAKIGTDTRRELDILLGEKRGGNGQ